MFVWRTSPICLLTFFFLDHNNSMIRLYLEQTSVRKKNLESVTSHHHVNYSTTNEQVRIKMGNRVAHFNTNAKFDTHFKYLIVNHVDKIDCKFNTQRVQFQVPNFYLKSNWRQWFFSSIDRSKLLWEKVVWLAIIILSMCHTSYSSNINKRWLR